MVELSGEELMLLCLALDTYMYDLSEREKRSEYWFRSHSLESYLQRAEENRTLLFSRMEKTDRLRTRFLLLLPLQDSGSLL